MKRAVEFFIKYPIWTNILMVTVLLFGFIALNNIKYSTFPEITPNLITIQVVYPGASPEEVKDILTRAGAFDMGGKCPVNPSGGVMSSNAIGATGLIRVAECAWQIQGRAEDRQVPDVKLALATGFGGCYWSDVLILGKEKPEKARG